MPEGVKQYIEMPKIPEDISDEMKLYLNQLADTILDIAQGTSYIEGDLNLGGSIIGLGLNVKSVTASYTITLSDDIILANGTFPVTLPTALSANKQLFYIKNIGSGNITVAAADTIDGSASKILTQYDYLLVVSNGSVWYLLRGL